MDSTLPCSVCKEPGHRSRKCPTLHELLKEGFYSGGGGGGGHDHEEDEKMMKDIPFPTCPTK